MDDHPPSWEGNGLEYLQGLVPADSLKPTISRLNLFLPVAHDALAKPVDAVRLARAVVENYSIVSLELYRCNLNAADISALSQALAVNKFITYIGLGRNRFYTEGGCIIAEMLKANQTLQHMDLSWNELRDEFAVSLAEALLMNNSLQRVVLDKNRITGDGASALAHAVGVNPKLRYVSLAQNAINAFGVGYLGKALTAHTSPSLLTLNLCGNAVPATGMFSLFSSIAAAPRPLSTLLTLNVAFNKIEASGTLLLGPALMRMPNLRELNLECTHLQHGPELKEFCKALASHRCLVNLSLARNPQLEEAGLELLCEAMAVAGTVKYLDLSDCGLTKATLSDGLQKLTKQATHLETLHLSDNDFSDDDCGAALARLLANSASLAFFGLQRCKLGMHGVERLFTTLHYRQLPLKGLTLRGNHMGDAGFAQLLPFVLHHGHFSFLDMAQNDLTSFITPRLPDVFQSNSELTALIVEDTTVFTPATATAPWDAVSGKSPMPKVTGDTTNLPPLTCAPMELPTGLAPSSGFATYSASNGSILRRQVEASDNLAQGLLPFAGQPVQHCRVWDRNAAAPVVANLRKPEFRGGPNDGPTVARLESNIGGLLVSDDQLRREFNRLDVLGQGALSVSSFKKIYRSMEHFGVERSDGEIDRVLRRYGVKADDGISFDVFCVVMLKLAQH